MKEEKDWYSFLTAEFAIPKEQIKVRDRVVASCSECGTTSVVIMNNLKKQVRKLGTHLCWSCSARKATLAAKDKYEATMLKRYGVRNPNQNPEVKARIRKTGLEKYGKEGAIGVARKAFKEKYGVENPGQVPEIKERIEDTLLEKYGVKSILSLKEVREKGIAKAATPDSRKKASKSFKKTTGFDNPLDYNRDRIRKTVKENALRSKQETLPQIIEFLKTENISISNENFYKRFGKSYTTIMKWLREEKLDHYINDSSIEEILGCKTLKAAGNKIASYIESRQIPAMSEEVEKHFNLSRPSLKKALYACGKEELIGRFKSLKQIQLVDFIKALHSNVRVNDRKIIKPQELDIVLPDAKLAIEFNGLYWHSEENLSNKNYHAEKLQKCKDLGWELLQINEDEWDSKPEIVKSIIKAKLSIFEKRIYARKCQIRKINRSEAYEFCEKNHLMGGFATGKNIGLFLADSLVAVIVYKKLDTGIDISRFCSLLNTQVIGGLSKMLTWLERNETLTFIQSFVDLRYGTGMSLLNIGFAHKSDSLGWKWTDFKNTFNRLQCRANMDERNLSQEEHAEELGWVKIYDAGQAKFVKESKT